MSRISLLQQPTEVNRVYPARNRVYPTRLLLLCLATVGLGISFFLAEHSLRPAGAATADNEVELTLGLSRQLGIMSVGLCGCLLLIAPGGRPLIFGNTLAKLILALGTLCLVSVFWSQDMGFTIRRLGSGVLFFTAVLGLCRQFGPRELCKLVLIICFAFLCVGIGVELAGQGFAMASSRYRFGGTVNPNLQGTYCALISLSAACLLKDATSKRWMLHGMFVLGVVFLVLTGSRTALYSFLAAIGYFWWLTSSPRVKALMLTGLPALITLLVVLYELFVGGTATRFAELVTVGRGVENVSDMNGRLPLWSALMEAVSARPFLGSGYQGFWRSDEFFELMDSAGWMTESAHNAFLDTVLSVGLIGGALHILVVIIGINLVRKHFMQTADVGYGFVLAVLVFATVHSLTESTFAKPLFPAMIFVTGLSMLAFQRSYDSRGVDRHTWARRSRPVQSIA